MVLVTDAAGDPVGILSERDLVQIMATEGCKLDDKLVSDAMTADLIVGVPDDDLEYVMSVMIQRRIRHLPILDGDHLAGLVSIGDVVKSQIDDAVTEIRFLRSYIGGTRANLSAGQLISFQQSAENQHVGRKATTVSVFWDSRLSLYNRHQARPLS